MANNVHTGQGVFSVQNTVLALSPREPIPLIAVPKRPKMQIEWQALFRGVYSRVAKKVGVDASYVSRVARGESGSPKIQRALQAELTRIDRLRPRK